MMYTLLITRPEPDASDMAALCVKYALNPIVCPVMQIVSVPLDAPLPQYDGIILTSPHAMSEYVLASLPAGSVFHVVGERCAEKIRLLGFTVATQCTSAAALRDTLMASLPAKHRLLYLSGEHITLDMAHDLALRSIACTRVITYRAVAIPALRAEAITAINARPAPFVFFGSIRAVHLFAELVGDARSIAKLRTLCLSAKIAAAARQLGFADGYYADNPSIPQLLSGFCATDCMNP